MSRMIQIDLDPEPRILRQFGWIALVGFSLLAFLAWQERLIFAFGLGEAREPVALGLLGVGALAAFLGLVAPRANRPIYVALTLLAYPIGFVLSHLILGVLFYLVIAPVGAALRLAGKDPMERRLDPDAESYWTEAKPARPASSYFKQY